MDGSEPRWVPEEHLDRVYRRGRQLRRRRRVLTAVGPTAAALVLVVVGLNGFRTATSGPRVRTVAQPPTTSGADNGGGALGDDTTTTTTPGGLSGGTTTTIGAATDGAAGPGSPSKRSAGGRSPASTTAPTSPPIPTGPTTTTTAGPCASSDLDYTTSTNKSSYARGQQVVISFVVHNHSGHPCDAPSVCGVGAAANVINKSGNVVWHSNPIAVTCVNPPPEQPHLAPGQSATYGAGTWDQTICTSSNCAGQQAPAGPYRAVAHRGSATASATPFSLSG